MSIFDALRRDADLRRRRGARNGDGDGDVDAVGDAVVEREEGSDAAGAPPPFDARDASNASAAAAAAAAAAVAARSATRLMASIHRSRSAAEFAAAYMAELCVVSLKQLLLKRACSPVRTTASALQSAPSRKTRFGDSDFSPS